MSTCKQPNKNMSIDGKASTMSNDEILEIWEAFDIDDNHLSSADHHQELIDDVISGDFLLMEVEVESGDRVSVEASSIDDDWSDSIPSRHAIAQLPSFYGDEDDLSDDDTDHWENSENDKELVETPSQADRQMVVFESENLHEITPEQPDAPLKVNFSDFEDLQLKCQRTLKKLASSMRRSDETRSIVKRQRLHSPVFIEQACGNSGTDFFTSSRASAMEESRRKLYNIINKGMSSTIKLSLLKTFSSHLDVSLHGQVYNMTTDRFGKENKVTATTSTTLNRNIMATL